MWKVIPDGIMIIIRLAAVFVLFSASIKNFHSLNFSFNSSHAIKKKDFAHHKMNKKSRNSVNEINHINSCGLSLYLQKISCPLCEKFVFIPLINQKSSKLKRFFYVAQQIMRKVFYLRISRIIKNFFEKIIKKKKFSHAGNRTRISWALFVDLKARYPSR